MSEQAGTFRADPGDDHDLNELLEHGKADLARLVQRHEKRIAQLEAALRDARAMVLRYRKSCWTCAFELNCCRCRDAEAILAARALLGGDDDGGV